MAAAEERPFATVVTPQTSGPGVALTTRDLTPLTRSDVMPDTTPSLCDPRFEALDDPEFLRAGDALMRTYNDALASLRCAEADYSAWRNEMVRRKP